MRISHFIASLSMFVAHFCYGEQSDRIVIEKVHFLEGGGSKSILRCSEVRDTIILSFIDYFGHTYVHDIEIMEFLEQSHYAPLDEDDALEFAASDKGASINDIIVRSTLSYRDYELDREIVYYIVGFKGASPKEDIVILPDGKLVVPRKADSEIVYGECARRDGEIKVIDVR